MSNQLFLYTPTQEFMEGTLFNMKRQEEKYNNHLLQLIC